MAVPVKLAWEVKAAAGKAPAVIRVKKLQTTISGPSDAWGRQGKTQPMLVSAEVSLAKPFGSSSAADAVAGDTVHYGLLSKAILASLRRLNAEGASGSVKSLRGVLDEIWIDLTGFDTSGGQKTGSGAKPFLVVEGIRQLRVTLHLPKASLLGDGISLTSTALFNSDGNTPSVEARALGWKIHELRLPTLIGVNDNERTAKQVVVANVEVERHGSADDAYCGLEAVVVKTISDSSFETLEALAATLASDVTEHLTSSYDSPPAGSGWHITIGLEKPIAVPLAEAACVELSTSTKEVLEEAS
ncbi:hypothetical protein S7711_09615 [Stachybotrys chartarum IBT 7711]|uniref:Dihydroneopterin aldolase/epimerase domain-containing protein n=1 Tax=Stachybotrys chartarum (strain CBS 109288 / IBT 7711) TaxID=1280523 RepID=A0A084AJY3_STACB|nr:hypothetical protein S7711_09615 [Stachybotrys chartarum IBT 7711]KFA46650.1 hypothetical protein S40293_09624 [Stachybotrys chartarum IBT 40293]KFA72926.1 hypothetical protein S40288_10131 [Stachybotrys chartarum IBT 40288]